MCLLRENVYMWKCRERERELCCVVLCVSRRDGGTDGEEEVETNILN